MGMKVYTHVGMKVYTHVGMKVHAYICRYETSFLGKEVRNLPLCSFLSFPESAYACT
jgi:hypothetical protein